ncbi:hypothetical protein JCM8202_001878 [Rhodotorula sphaerocarpa]
MAITLLTSPPEALSREELAAISAATPSTFEGIAPLTRHHEPAGVRIRLEPGFEGWTGHGLEGALWITEGALSFYSETAQQGISLPYPHITLHAISRDPAPAPAPANGTNGEAQAEASTGSSSSGSDAPACIYCQVEESEEILEDTDGLEESGTREMWITPADPASVDKIFSTLSYCASLHPASTDPSAASFLQADSSDPSSSAATGADGQSSLLAAMGLDPASMVFANADGTLGGAGLAAMQASTDGEGEDARYADGAEGEGEAGADGRGQEESSAGRQRSEFVNEGRARGAPY